MRKQIKKNSIGILTAGALFVSGVLAGGIVTGGFYNAAKVGAEEETLGETGSVPETGGTVSGLPDVSDLVERCNASVVAITNNIEEVTSYNGYGFYGFGGSNGQSSTREMQAYGSGVIVDQNDDELLIVTNNHVAVYDESGESVFYQYNASSTGLTVTFIDGTEAEATLKGADEESDLAVIAVPTSEVSRETKAAIKLATIGNSDETKVGQGVIAIGNALGLGQTTTVGYVSALNRSITIEGYTRSLMQIDAAINGGNSGGGLFNGKGELIGINCAKRSQVGVEGVGFAIPITSAKSIIDTLMTRETRDPLDTDERGYLGILGQDVSTSLVQNYGYPAGAQIIQITEGSPAQASGLQLWDIVTAVNGIKVSNYDSLRTQMSYYAPGETVTLTVQRISGNEFTEVTIDVTLTDRESVDA